MIVTDFDCFLLKSITTTNLATRPPTSSLERPSSLWGVLCFLQCSPRSVLEKWTNKAQPPGTDLVWRIIVDINSASQNICLYFTLIPTTYAAYYWCIYAPWHVGKSYHRAPAWQPARWIRSLLFPTSPIGSACGEDLGWGKAFCSLQILFGETSSAVG